MRGACTPLSRIALPSVPPPARATPACPGASPHGRAGPKLSRTSAPPKYLEFCIAFTQLFTHKPITRPIAHALSSVRVSCNQAQHSSFALPAGPHPPTRGPKTDRICESQLPLAGASDSRDNLTARQTTSSELRALRTANRLAPVLTAVPVSDVPRPRRAAGRAPPRTACVRARCACMHARGSQLGVQFSMSRLYSKT